MNCYQKVSRPRTNATHFPHIGNIVNELFNTAVGDVVQKSERKYFTNPATNVVAYDDKYILDISLPGFAKKDVEILVEDDLLKVRAKENKEDSGINFRLREYNYAGFKKSFRLPETVDPAQIQASFNLGILRITLPKKSEAVPVPTRKIIIK